eukprot:scaffold2331_cov126-Cylindrotheca_fusiformis.AAC.9
MCRVSSFSILILLFCQILQQSIQGFLLPLSSKRFDRFPPTSMVQATVDKTEAEWKELLTPDQYFVLREEGTEPPNTSGLNDINDAGTFTCAGCGTPLFTTETKFDSGTGWPSFYAPIDQSSVKLSTDFKLILPRTECSCAACGGHLGHVFGDGPDPTGQRFCMNGVAMKFSSDQEYPDLAANVSVQQDQDPYKVGMWQVVPGVMINGILGGLFFNSFLIQFENGLSSPLDALPLLPAIYFGVLAVRTCGRLLLI